MTDIREGVLRAFPFHQHAVVRSNEGQRADHDHLLARLCDGAGTKWERYVAYYHDDG